MFLCLLVWTEAAPHVELCVVSDLNIKRSSAQGGKTVDGCGKSIGDII